MSTPRKVVNHGLETLQIKMDSILNKFASLHRQDTNSTNLHSQVPHHRCICIDSVFYLFPRFQDYDVSEKLNYLTGMFNSQADLIQDTRSLLINSSIMHISHDNDELKQSVRIADNELKIIMLLDQVKFLKIHFIKEKCYLFIHNQCLLVFWFCQGITLLTKKLIDHLFPNLFAFLLSSPRVSAPEKLLFLQGV